MNNEAYQVRETKDFRLFLTNKEVKIATFITIFAAVSSELLQSLSTHLIIPLIDGDVNEDGELDISKNLKQHKTQFRNKILYTGEFLYILIKFLIIVIFLYILYKMF